MTERELQHAVLLRWGAHPRLTLVRTNTGAAMAHGRLIRFGQPGTPDIQGIMAPSGRYVGIEIKSPTGKQSPEQVTWQRVFTSKGGVYILARCMADVDEVLIPLVGAP